MNAEKKRLGTKAQIRAEKERQRRIGTVIFTALILIVITFSAYFGYQILSTPSPSEGETALPEPTYKSQLTYYPLKAGDTCVLTTS